MRPQAALRRLRRDPAGQGAAQPALASASPKIHSPVPVAVYLNSDWCREFAEASLNHQGLRWRRAWYCDVASGMRNAVTNGMAISPLSRSTIPAGCRELTAEEGFPAIDSARVLLRRNPRGTSPAIEGMAAVLREAFRPLAVALPHGQSDPPAPERNVLAPRL